MKTTKLENATLIKTIGTRMREARELCNLSQSAAAKRMGYVNSSMLCKVESGRVTANIEPWLISRAAQVYEVSVDFLYGLNDDWEIGARMTQERRVSSWLWANSGKLFNREMLVLRKLNNKLEIMSESVAVMLAAVDEVESAFGKFRELNPEFDDMKAGARLESSICRAVDATKCAKAKLTKFHIECALAAGDTKDLQLSLL